MVREHRVVDNRTFLLAMDNLYRDAMKRHERHELLECARETTEALSVLPVETPIEGYYAEDEQLTEYFRLMRTLQQVSKARQPQVASLDGYQRLKQVTGSGLLGLPCEDDSLLPAGMDPLSLALDQSYPRWSILSLTDAAYRAACASDDYSLVALAALSLDPVLLARLRETMVLYEACVGGCGEEEVEPEYVWAVDAVIETRAVRFVSTFNNLFNDSLPEPAAANAAVFWNAAQDAWSNVIGLVSVLGLMSVRDREGITTGRLNAVAAVWLP